MHHQGASGMQEVIQMCSSFDATKSTKGASKLRRDLINAEIANLRDLLPLPSSTRQRLSQLQLMALVCVYVRKANYFQQVFKRYHELGHPYSTPNIGFSKALSGFLIMMTQNGKLLYISDNAAEYLGHSMEDLLIHGDSVYDIIDKADHGTVQTELLRNSSPQNPPGEETRLFLCRMNVSRNARRQMRFGDQKVVLLQGHYLSYLPLCSRNEPVFVGSCTPVAMPETRECVVQGATNVFTTIHAMDMKFMHIDRNGEYYLGYSRSELGGISWYQLIHWNYMREAQSKHRLISQSEQEKSCILLLRLETRGGEWLWVHCVLQVKDGSESSNSQQQPQQSVIVATNQVLSEREAGVMRANSWLYHYYTVQTKLQYGLAYPETSGNTASPTAAAAARLAAAAYFPSAQSLMNYSNHHPHHMHGGTSEPFTTYATSTSGVMQPPIHHNGTAHGYTNPYHHPHPYPYPHTFEGGKESPLDFSLAAASQTIPFEFQMGSNPYGSYWAHTHHHHHPSPSNNNNNVGGGQSHLSHHPSSHSHSHNNNNNSYGSSSQKSEGSSRVSPSATSPQAWSLSSPSIHLPSSLRSNNLNVNVTNLSPSSNTITSGAKTPRKKMKKSVEIVSESSSPPLNSTGSSNEAANRSSSYTIGHHHNNSEGSIATLAPSVPFPYHTRHRSLYKIFSSTDDEHCSVKEENLAMACPLTPSPIWEGQTQRVPDLQLYNHHHHSSTIGINGNSDGNGSILSGPDLIHCVPTYQPYLPFCPSTPSSNNGGTSGGHPVSGGYGSIGISMGISHPQGFHSQIMLDSSPNKENRLPPTPESDSNENDENKPIKWESL